jgi:hypothetical protein
MLQPQAPSGLNGRHGQLVGFERVLSRHREGARPALSRNSSNESGRDSTWVEPADFGRCPYLRLKAQRMRVRRQPCQRLVDVLASAP